MLMWLAVCMGVAFGSALLPLISIEIFLIALVSQEPGLPCLALGAAIAIGQVAGKLIYFWAARGDLHLPAFMRRRPKPLTRRRHRMALRTKRIRALAERITERCRRHPRWMVGTYGVSSVVGVPPFMATSVLAGMARMKLSAFVSAGLLGRFVRFSVLAASPAIFAGWLF